LTVILLGSRLERREDGRSRMSVLGGLPRAGHAPDGARRAPRALEAVLKLLTGQRCTPLLSGSRIGEHLLHPLRWALSAGGGFLFDHPHAASRDGSNEALGAEHVEGAHDGADGDLVLLGQGLGAGQGCSGLDLPRGDLITQQPG